MQFIIHFATLLSKAHFQIQWRPMLVMNENLWIGDESVQIDHQLSQINGLHDLTGRWYEAPEIKHFIVLWIKSFSESRVRGAAQSQQKKSKWESDSTAEKRLKRCQRQRVNSTFDWAGGDDTLCCSSISPRYNTGLIEIGTRYHHLL